MAGYAADSVPGGEHHEIAKDPDLVITLTHYERFTFNESGQLVEKVVPVRFFEFFVARKILINVSHFRERIPLPVLGKASLDIVALKDDDPRAVKIWLQILHGTYDVASYSAPIITLWHMLAIADKYRLDPKDDAARKWFEDWLATRFRHTYEECCELLLPLCRFDHAAGFAAVTCQLAYTGQGHIMEKRPYGFRDDHLRLGQGVIQQINAARGRLKTILHRELYAPVDHMLAGATCPYREKVLWQYFKALTETEAWPIESAAGKCGMRVLLDKLRGFEYWDPHDEGSCKDARCSRGREFTVCVERAVRETEEYFKGLCLDCMYRSLTADTDREYWSHAERRTFKFHGYKCRIGSHDQPSWYFSFMGRKRV